MPDGLIGIDAFRAAVRAKRKPEGGVFHVLSGVPKAYDDGSRRVRFVFSDGSVDRMGDTIDPSGWDTGPFLKNPVALWAHDSSQPPIGRASNVFVEDGALAGDIEFAPPETYAFAETIYRLVVGKFINAVSVGFLPIEYDWAEDEENRPWGLDFKLQELLEISVVPVPANANALATARSKGIDTKPLMEWAERTLDNGGKIIVPRAELEQLRKAAKPAAGRRPKSAAAPRRTGRAPDGLGETDPAAGGALVATCGRPADQDCGLKNPAECSVHADAGDDAGAEEENKRMVATVRRAVREELRRALKSGAKPRRRDATGDEPGDAEPPLAPEQEKSFRAAHAHLKAAEDFYAEGDDHHDKAMDLLDDIKDSIDENPNEPDGEPASPDADTDKAALVRRAAAIRRRHGV